MKRAFATLSAAALAAGIFGGARAAAPKPPSRPAKPVDACAAKSSKFARSQCEGYTHSAPGDEYFGRLKLSYLGINNTFRDEAVRAASYTTDAGIIGRVDLADDALRAWANKYPGDPQLPRSYFLAIQVMRKIYTQPMQDRAWQIMQVLVKTFPSSYFGKIMSRSLRVGFTEHYFAVPLPCPTSNPTLPPGVRATPTPRPTSTPIPTPEPSPTATPGPNQPKVVVLTPACVIVTPSPSPTPSFVPTPAPSGTPATWPLPAAPIRGIGSPLPETPSAPLTPQPTHKPRPRSV